MTRELNRATIYNEATAKATETRTGEATVTVQGTYRDGARFASTNTLHLSAEAALALYRDLKEVLVL